MNHSASRRILRSKLLKKRLPDLALRAALQARLTLESRLARGSVVQRGAPVVSLTTHGDRIDRVHLTIQSIARGSMKPSRLILWVDSAGDMERALRSSHITRLRRRGLELRASDPMGPHSKYFPYVRSAYPHETALVTADDDVFYPREWLDSLSEAYEASPEHIHCFRAHQFSFAGKDVAPYMSWPEVATTEPSFATFLTGVSGVIYPPPFLDHLYSAGEAFRLCAPRADDVWLHAQAVEAGIRVRQLRPSPVTLPVAFGTQSIALWKHNASSTAGGPVGNDTQIRATYTDSALATIRAEERTDD